MKPRAKQTAHRLAAVLALAISFATGGAWAATTTYCQPEGTSPAEPIWGYEMGGILTVDDEITTTPKLAFAGITLDDLPAQGSYFSSMYGGNIDDDYAPVVGMHRQTCDTDGDGHIDKVALQMGVYDGGHTKCVIVVLTNGDGGVYVQRYCQLHKNNSPNMFIPYYTLNADGTISKANSPNSWNTPGTGYQLAGFKIRGTSPLVSRALAFPGKTLAELKDFAFVSDYRFGRAMQVTATNNFATFVTHWTNPNNPDDQKLVMQIANPNDIWKAAILEMTDGVGGVWVRQSRHAYNNMGKRFSVDATTGEVTGGTQTVNTPPEYPVHGLYALPLETVKLSKKTKAFSNGNPSAPLTLDDIKDGEFSSRMCGINVPVSFLEPDSALGYNKKVYEDGGSSVTNIIVEFQVRDGTFTKCVVVSLENGADGIYATALGARYTENALGYEFYKQDRTWNSGISNYTLSEDFGGGYGAFDLRVTVPAVHEWTLDGDKTWSALRGSETVAANEVVRIAVTDADAVLTVDEDVYAARIVFVDGAGATLKINSGCTVSAENISGLGYVLNNGTLVKIGDGTVAWPFDNTSIGTTTVSSGTLKVASKSGAGTSNPTHTVRVASGATFDANGVQNLTISVVLEDGAFFVNTGAAIGNTTYQTINVSLEGDATVTAGKNFGLMAPGYASTGIALGSNTLSFNGTSGFWLENTTITGDGTINVESGTLQCARANTTGVNCTLNIGASGELRIDGTKTLCVSNFYNGGNLVNGNNFSGTAYGTLLVNGTLTTGNAMTNITLAAGATVKATGAPQVVSGTFSASGTVTIDASEITAETLRSGDVAVLTVPAAFNPSGATWNVTGAAISGTRTKWRTDEGGATKTLYVGKPTGMMVILR